MIVQRTPEQQKKLEDILAKIRQDFLKDLGTKDATEERTKLYMAIQDAIDTFAAKEEAAAFKKLKGDRQAIIDSAKEQIGLVIEQTKSVFLVGNPQADLDGLVVVGILVKTGNKYLINATYMITAIKDELALHLNALQNDKNARTEINNAILAEIYKNEHIHTDNLEFTEFDPARAKLVLKERDKRLGKINYQYLMSAKTPREITVTHPDLLIPDADGQLTMKWIVPQADEKKSPVPTTVHLTYTGDELKGVKRNIKPFDIAVMDTVYSAMTAWEFAHPGEPLKITPTALFRLIKGRQPTDKACRVSSKQLQDLGASLRKLNASDIAIDIQAEVKAHYLSEEGLALLKESGNLSGYYISDKLIDVVTVGVFDDTGNRIPTEYIFSRKPIFGIYSEAKGNVLSVPFDILDVFNEKNLTDHAIEIRNYLIIQIENMKNPKGYRKKKNNNKVLLSTLYKYAGMKDPQTRVELREEGDENGENKTVFANDHSRRNAISKERAKDRAVIENMLKEWVKKGYIKSYKIDSLCIEIDPGTDSKNKK